MSKSTQRKVSAGATGRQYRSIVNTINAPYGKLLLKVLNKMATKANPFDKAHKLRQYFNRGFKNWSSGDTVKQRNNTPPAKRSQTQKNRDKRERKRLRAIFS